MQVNSALAGGGGASGLGGSSAPAGHLEKFGPQWQQAMPLQERLAEFYDQHPEYVRKPSAQEQATYTYWIVFVCLYLFST